MMAEYKVTINATPSKAKVISVSPKNLQNTITASPDTSLYYSNLSKKWATEMDGMVNGEDYSSKYYANVSAQNAQISQTNAQACEDARVLLQGEYNEYSENLLETKTNAVDEINTLTDNSISELQAELSGLRTSASTIVSTSKTDIQNTATSAKNTAISAIQTQQTTSVNAVKTEGTTQVNLAKAQATAAANSATQASEVVKQVEDDLDSKVDIDDMVEVDFVEVPTIIEVSDPSLMPSWYRVWSNGWCEQGGNYAGSDSLAITLLKQYRDGYYNLVTSGTARILTQTATGFTIDTNYGDSGKSSGYWRTCGYIA